MANSYDPRSAEALKRRKFLYLCGAGAVVVVLGLLLPRVMVDPQPERPVTVNKEATSKVLPPSVEKRDPTAKALPPEKETNKPPEMPDAPSMGAMLTKLVGGTLAVLVLCAATAYGVGRWMKGKSNPTSSGPMKLLAVLPLTGRSSIYLVEVGDQHLVAGVDATGLKVMLHLPGGISESDRVEEATPAEAQPPVESEPVIATARIPISRLDATTLERRPG